MIASAESCSVHISHRKTYWSQEDVYLIEDGCFDGLYVIAWQVRRPSCRVLVGSPVLRAYREVQLIGFGPVCRLLCKGRVDNAFEGKCVYYLII